VFRKKQIYKTGGLALYRYF